MTQHASIAQWRESILSRLEEDQPKGATNISDRIEWLGTHLDEYVERWIGFSEHPSVSPEPISHVFASDQFAIIGLAIELINHEMPQQGVSEHTVGCWNRLLRVYQDLRVGHDMTQRNALRHASNEFVASFGSSNDPR